MFRAKDFIPAHQRRSGLISSVPFVHQSTKQLLDCAPPVVHTMGMEEVRPGGHGCGMSLKLCALALELCVTSTRVHSSRDRPKLNALDIVEYRQIFLVIPKAAPGPRP